DFDFAGRGIGGLRRHDRTIVCAGRPAATRKLGGFGHGHQAFERGVGGCLGGGGGAGRLLGGGGGLLQFGIGGCRGGAGVGHGRSRRRRGGCRFIAGGGGFLAAARKRGRGGKGEKESFHLQRIPWM